MFYFWNIKWAVIDKNGKQVWSYGFEHLAKAHASMIGGSVKYLD